jgi:hypothetical protein
MVKIKLTRAFTLPIFGPLPIGTEMTVPGNVAAHMIVSGYAVYADEPPEPELPPPPPDVCVEPASAPEKETEE